MSGKSHFSDPCAKWQVDYKKQNRNGLAPCPNRDHHDELEQLLRDFEPEPTDVNAAEILTDPGYTQGLKAYNREFEGLTNDIWKKHYIKGEDGKGSSIAPLPDLPILDKTGTEVRLDEPAESK